jgi:feruloyl esterase
MASGPLRPRLLFVCSLLVVLTTATASSARAAACESLRSLRIDGTSVTLTQGVDAGAFTIPGQREANASLRSLPAFCRVTATLTPSADSDIKIEVWLPTSIWNGKLLGVGNGGWSGSIPYTAMIDGLRRGYAVASTDTGHVGSDARFALGHPEKLIDFGYRAVHEMTIVAKRVIAAHYGNAPRLSYWNGCSAGGRQGLKEAQRFPADFDGIVAGAPAADWTGRAAQALRVWQALHKDESNPVSPTEFAFIHDAVLRTCDRLDGVADGVLENPRACRFDPSVLECRADGVTRCLTRSQIEAVRQAYAAAPNPKTHRSISALEPGSELGWMVWGNQPFPTAVSHFRDVVYKNPAWDVRTFDYASDIVRADDEDGGTINALDPNLQPFFDRGGKLLHYHGWNDPQIAPGNSVQYYESVLARSADPAAVPRAYRLFMLPGMAHCRGGEGPDLFDALGALERWVERGTAPDSIEASRRHAGTIDRTRPICSYPRAAIYNGTGSTNEASSFVCGEPSR